MELPRLGARTSARQRALEVLYQADLLEQPISTVLARELNDPRRQRPDRYAIELAGGVERRMDEVDERIEAAAERWSIDRMPLVDRNLLRLATFELLSSMDVPTAVILDEAIELAKLLSTEDSSRFINGVLGRIARDVRGG
ncbi:MAG TPA: transcription antitermination factor NusB [Actinomycetes bacterium]|nr:transcription antitermination factor NusB [Actinomycetes bacterium]